MDTFLKRAWAQIDLDALEHNYKVIRKAVNPKSKIMCVIKADAYGHGATRLAKEFERLGADWFAVSNLEEAMQIRKINVKTPILILGYTPTDMAEIMADNNISQAAISEDYANDLSLSAKKLNKKVKVHIKLDTGMNRIGILDQNEFQKEQALESVKNILNMDGLIVEGLFTHFAVADEGEDGDSYTKMQYRNFKQIIEELNSEEIHIPLCHCSNSAAVADYPEMNLDMVRPGIILYGLHPSSKIRNKLDLKPVMQFKSTVSLVKTVSKNTRVSYGGSFITKRETKIATVPLGYADGYQRCMSGKARMLVKSQEADIIGRICMDQLMLDVTDIDGVQAGDIVTVFGCDKDKTISVDEVAKLNNTINYEIVCLVGKRVPRIYYKNGSFVGQLNYIYT